MISDINKIADAYDVVVCGGGLAGLTLAYQIRRELPDVSLLLLELSAGDHPLAAFKVGESLTEVSTYYITEILGLKDYMKNCHLRKMGLRFFMDYRSDRFEDRAEFGSSEFDPVETYQIDRGILENHLKQFNADLGVTAIENARVKDIILGDGDDLHQVFFTERSTNRTKTINCRWVVDAMGRRRMIQKKLGLGSALSKDCSAVWFRYEGRIDVGDFVPRTQRQWHERVPGGDRYYSTNHLMSRGRWVWLIPLASECTSVGIVTREDVIPFSEYNTYKRALSWLNKNEPHLYAVIADRQPLDFKSMRYYSYTSKQVYSRARWACSGEAGVFSDPLFSPGIDQIGFGNMIITEMIRLDRKGELTAEIVDHFNKYFLGYNIGATWITQPDYYLHGNHMVMAAKLLWDILSGWMLNGPQRFNRIYLDPKKSAVIGSMLAKVTLLAVRVKKLCKDWAARPPGQGYYQFFDYAQVPGVKEIYARSLRSNKSFDEIVEDYKLTIDFLEELTQVIFLVALEDTMPQMLEEMPPPVWLNAWGVSLNPERWKADKLFSPTTKPRDLNPLLNKLRSILGLTSTMADSLKA